MGRPWTTAELRERFLGFFAERGHTVHPSASLVPAGDPTTLFTVAGMSQFKDMFLGRGTLDFSRAATCQKCIRTNDILNVGRTPRHHTFFEMLGNFSFNDYFKRETIAWAWEFLTDVLALDPERLWVTVNEIDDEAWDIWTGEVGVPESRIMRLGDDDNFWPASAPTEGPTGPGGCCSEIFWDFRTNDDPDDDPAGESGRFVEIWNLVFPQFNVTEPKKEGRYTLEELGRQNIDTGMGLERIACVVQGVYNNFDIDLLQTVVASVARTTGVPYVAGAERPEYSLRQLENNALLRRIADHVRAVSFCIADGALPENVGRGYVVRRLIRRATLDADKLGVDESRLHRVVASVVAAMGDVYPELGGRRELIEQTLEAEEDQFRKTLRRGMDLFEKDLARHRQEKAESFSGDDAFELFTTYGFPVEVTEELAGNEGLSLDRERFRERMEEFADISKGGREQKVFTDSALIDAKPRLGATAFVGHDTTYADADLRFIEIEGREVAEAPPGSRVRVALDRTPFYPEGGGQVGDVGDICGSGPRGAFRIAVADTQRDEDLIVHGGEVVEGTATLGPVQAMVDEARRRATTRHHSATHLLHSALGRVLGDHVQQQGSKVEPEALRFDFNHPKALERDEIEDVERWVDEAIRAANPVAVAEMPIAEAKERGAKAMFDEKYGNLVRVVTMGDPDVSIELCGGCHVDNTADIERFRILKEEATAAGIRRIVAVAGDVAARVEAEERELAAACAAACGLAEGDPREIGELAQLLKARPEQLPERIAALRRSVDDLAGVAGEEVALKAEDLLDRVVELQQEQKRLRRKGEEAQARAAVEGVDRLLQSVVEVAGTRLVTAALDDVPAKALQELADALRQRLESYCVVLGSRHQGKVLLLAAVSPDRIDAGIEAGNLVRRIAPIVGGGGGGKADVARAGGKNPEKLDEALAAARELVEGAG